MFAGETVNFTQMKDGTREEYRYLEELERAYTKGTASRILDHLSRLEQGLSGYKISRLDHSLQSATMAERDGADIDWVVSALLHDIGDDLAPTNHSKLAAAVLEPYVREQCTWVMKTHGLFQMVYYAHHLGGDRFGRDKFKDHPYYQDAIDFCEYWDQGAFDPNYDTYPLSHFQERVEEVFARPAWDVSVIQPNVRVPLRPRETAAAG